MKIQVTHKIYFFFLYSILGVATTSCTLFNPPPPKPAVTTLKAHPHGTHSKPLPLSQDDQEVTTADVQPVYPANALMKELSLAFIALQRNDHNAALTHMLWLQGYGMQPSSQLTQSVVILSYSLNGGKPSFRIAAPFTPVSYNNNFPDVLELINAMGTGYELQDIRTATITLTAINIPDANAKTPENRGMVQEDIASLLQSARPLASLKQAELYLQLTQFFIRHDWRDGAYLSMENAKQALAEAEEQTPDNLKVIALAHQLESTERELSAEMPFTLKSFK